MGDVIQLSSDDEENKGKLRKEKSPRKGDNVRKNPGSKGVLGESLSTESKKNVPRSGSKSSGKKLCDGMKTDGAAGESWSAFQKFIQFCHDTEVHRRNGDPSLSNKICSKLSERYKKADPEFTQSETFRDLLKSVGNVVKQDPKNLYVHMRQVHDELHIRSVKQKNNNHKRKAGEAEDDNHSSKRSKTTASDSSGDPEDESKAVNQGHCKKLERLFTKVYRKVKQLEEKEVDWDDEVNSNYIRLETYKKRLWAIWEKWQEARGHSDEVKKLKHQKIAFSGTLYPALDHTIEKYLNKTKCFPDFVDIFKLTSETLNKEKEFSEEQIKSIASAAFQILGNQLQKRRVYDFWNCCLSYLPSASDGLVSVSDPADNDAELAKALRENKEKYNRKISDVIDSFVEKQDDEKHEPEEVVLNSDDETSTHSGDEDESEEDKPEDIINISSTSSENSGGETDVDEKKPKSNSGKPKTNGVGIKEESTSDSDSDHTPDYIPLGASTSKDSPGCSGVMKKALVVKVEKCVVPSTSGVHIKKSSSSEFSKKKIDKKAEVVTLSESDSSGE